MVFSFGENHSESTKLQEFLFFLLSLHFAAEQKQRNWYAFILYFGKVIALQIKVHAQVVTYPHT
ncbi:hypothetical protein Mucpa_6365 [Mucilaginibacter paludis DSM 18603]|uniref:Uncharacterized protein n=1 Tax=Mucilaginibacter paludis DSM 18603 TaxID=714943 RepID=H1Y5Z7_9SPHI|nr:hypothetical protein Mucpa_6365 [Mucilaginibacter paludis DSM 18603]